MICRPRIFTLFIGIFALMNIVATAAPSSDKPVKEETPAAAASTEKAKTEPAADAASKDKAAKAEPAPAAASSDKPAKEEPAAPTAAAKPAKAEPVATPTPPATPPVPTYTVKREPLKIQFELDGTFESRTMSEIILRPEEWISYTVLKAVEHGTRVKKGDVLIEFDSEKIDKAIADLQAEQQIADIALKVAEDQLALLEKSIPLDLEASQRAQRQAEEDQKRYFELTRPMIIKSWDNMLKYTRQELDYAREELDQLEKMYKADDLTEETEKIVLKRARNTVDRAEFNMEREQYDHDQTLNIQLPRNDVQIKDNTLRRNLAWNKDRVELPLALEKQRLDVAKLKVQMARSKERLKNLLADQELMKIKAPADGYVYYGRCQRGKFNEISSMQESLRSGGSIMPLRTIITIVEPRPIFIHSTASEDRLQYIRMGMDGKATPTGYPDLKLDVNLDEISKLPISMGSYDIQFSLDLTENPAKVILPGMGCKIRFIPYSKSDALVIPPKTLMTDPLDDDKHFVYLQTKDGKSEKHDVTVGKQTDKLVEILKGLSEGDKILLEAPKDAK